MATVDDALANALAGPLTPVEWDEEAEPLSRPKLETDGEESVITH